LPIVDIEVVLDDPAVGDLQMPAVGLAIADRRHDARRLARLENGHDGIGTGPLEIGVDELVAPPFRLWQHGDVPLFRPPFQPPRQLLGNVAQRVPAHRVKLPVGVEEADDALRLLERLDQAVQQDAIKAPVTPPNAVPMVLTEGVHERPPLTPCQQGYCRSVSSASPQVAGRKDIKGKALG
jgi:hypothetical protein